MGLLPTLSGPVRKPALGGKPKQLVVLLHGVGADGNDLIGLAPYWAPALPDAEFVSPDAPFPCDMAPYGRQWFSLQNRSADAILAGVRAAAPILDAFLDDALAQRGLDASKLALVGFSQGTMMSLYVGPRRAKALAGIVGYSGALIGADTLAEDIRSRPPVLLVHGDADQIVPPQAFPLAVAGLKAAGVAVEELICPGVGHSIDEAGLRRGGDFLRKVLL
ncbi:MAG TPA: prolyl oligopeptidase family serine peptidase [Stellaceae bacterium]|nr:prolyl oligopeptidase family serine peptidase [Stellaceae bacterium]